VHCLLIKPPANGCEVLGYSASPHTTGVRFPPVLEEETHMATIDYSSLPVHMQKGARLYVEKGIKPGGFLRAVLENDLVEAATKADPTNVYFLDTWARWLLDEAPLECWGAPGWVEDWILRGGLEGGE
jgi:hypothetical protein